jgi:hypothetical protein
MSSAFERPAVYCVSMIEAAELTQQAGKTGAQKQETTASLAADTLIEATKEGSKGFVNGLMQQEIGPVFSREKPERIPIPVNQERAATRPHTARTPSPLAAPVSELDRKDRRESQARINKIRQELKQPAR